MLQEYNNSYKIIDKRYKVKLAWARIIYAGLVASTSVGRYTRSDKWAMEIRQITVKPTNT